RDRDPYGRDSERLLDVRGDLGRIVLDVSPAVEAGPHLIGDNCESATLDLWRKVDDVSQDHRIPHDDEIGGYPLVWTDQRNPTLVHQTPNLRPRRDSDVQLVAPPMKHTDASSCAQRGMYIVHRRGEGPSLHGEIHDEQEVYLDRSSVLREKDRRRWKCALLASLRQARNHAPLRSMPVACSHTIVSPHAVRDCMKMRLATLRQGRFDLESKRHGQGRVYPCHTIPGVCTLEPEAQLGIRCGAHLVPTTKTSNGIRTKHQRRRVQVHELRGRSPLALEVGATAVEVLEAANPVAHIGYPLRVLHEVAHLHLELLRLRPVIRVMHGHVL